MSESSSARKLGVGLVISLTVQGEAKHRHLLRVPRVPDTDDILKTKTIFPSTENKEDQRGGGQGKNKGRQSQTFASYIKTTYLNKELSNIFQ